MNTSYARWTSLSLLLCCLAACSSDTPKSGSRGATPGMPVAGTTSVPIAGTGNFGGVANGTAATGVITAGNNGGAAGQMPVLPVDADAAPYVIDDSAMSGLDAAKIDSLKTASASCAVMVTYPYDNTIYPGGLTPPIIMWEGGGDAALVHFSYQASDKVDYTFAAPVGSPSQIQIPRLAWNEITRRTNRQALNVTLNVSANGTTSTCKLIWQVAPGNMIGALYYNTYQAPPPGVPGQGAVMRQTLGSVAEIYKQFDGPVNGIPSTGPCYSCHSVSFNGTTMVASFHDYSAQVFRVDKFDIKQEVQPAPSGTVENANFGALTPTGDKILAMGNPQCTAGSDSFPRKPNNFPLVEGAAVARLLNTATGEDLHATGLNADFYMWMPQFSPDGTKVVFNHGKPDGQGGSDRSELAVMDFDTATNTFSNLRVIVSSKAIGAPQPTLAYQPVPAFGGVLACGADMCGADGNTCMSGFPGIPGIPGDVGALPTGTCAGPCYPAWPFFTPDGKAVVYALNSTPDFTQAFPGRDEPSASELWYVDLEAGQTIRMDNANKGRDAFDSTNNYYPTVMPVAVGGYFWVFWTAVRDYGHIVAGRDPGTPVIAAAEASKKRIWGAAIRPKVTTVENQDPTLYDPSSPGFYLDGQSDSGNVRAFAALNPCLDNGASCASGLDCCCGYCDTSVKTDGTGTCTCDPPMCSKINEKCTKDTDCCAPEGPDDPVLTCLGGFCGFIFVN